MKATDRLVNKIIRAEAFAENELDENECGPVFDDVMHAGLGPAFYLTTKDLPFLPDKIRIKGRTLYEDALLFKDYAVCCLKELRHDLCKSGRVVIIKGLALCETVYHEPRARPMGDVDLYFPDGTIEEARNVLLKNGYTCFDAGRTVVCRGELHIDMHEDLWNTRRIKRRSRCMPDVQESFWPSRLVPGFYIPSPGLLALHSSFHCVKHCFSRKLWYLDLVLMHKEGYFKELISGTNSLMALVALDQCKRTGVINANLPAPPLASYKKVLLKRLFSMKESPGTGEFALTLSMPRLRDSIGYFAESLFPRKEILKEMYGSHPPVSLFFRRIFVLLSYTFKMLVSTITTHPLLPSLAREGKPSEARRGELSRSRASRN